MAGDRRVEAVCESCGSSFVRSSTAARRARQHARQTLCKPCRYPGAVEGEDRLQRWWLEESGLELEALREIAVLLWPELAPLRLSAAA